MTKTRGVGFGFGLLLISTYCFAGLALGQEKIKLKVSDFLCFPENTPTKVTTARDGVLLTRAISGKDAGCEFRPDGETIPLDVAHGRIEIQPLQSINRGYYVITITFLGRDNRWADKDWIEDVGSPRSTRLQILPDVLNFAKDKGVTGMDRYSLKIRVQPQTFAGEPPGFLFGSISIGSVR